MTDGKHIFIPEYLEVLHARAHEVFERKVVEIRCPAGTSVLTEQDALKLANNIIEQCKEK